MSKGHPHDTNQYGFALTIHRLDAIHDIYNNNNLLTRYFISLSNRQSNLETLMMMSYMQLLDRLIWLVSK